MSEVIDNRIVQLLFDNHKFEGGIKDSLAKLTSFDEALESVGDNDGFERVNNSARKLNFNGLLSSAQAVSDRFSTLGIIGMTALQNITNKAVDAGERLVKSLSIDQMSAGWNKYEKKTSNVQTIMNATGKNINQVNGYLEKLMWFSDETSYGFTDMTQALATMTASGGDIEKIIPMITGIANSVAYAGKGAAEFSRVMYNLNQSYSLGYLSYQDLKSVKWAGADSKQLYQSLIDAGIALGTLDKNGRLANGTLVTTTNIADTLSQKWATTAVMEKAFGEWSKFSEAVYEAVDSGKYKTAAEAMKAMSKNFDKISVKGFEAAQTAKSFTEAIDATKDAVSSGWSQTFEKIFGNYEQAKELWTDFANDLYDIFVEPSNNRNSILDEWLDLKGRKQLIDSFKIMMVNLKRVIGTVSDAFHNIFPPMTGRTLKNLTQDFLMLVEKLTPFNTTLDKIERLFTGLFAAIDIGLIFIKSLIRVLGNLSPEAEKLFDLFLEGSASFADLVVEVRDYLKESDILYKGLQKIYDFIVPIFSEIISIIKKAKETFEEFTGINFHIPNFEEIQDFVKNIKKDIAPISKTLDTIKGVISSLWTIVKNVVGGINKILFGENGVFTQLSPGKAFIVGLITVITKKILDAGGLINTIRKALDSLATISSDFLKKIKMSFSLISKSMIEDKILKFAYALGIMAIALLVISAINTDRIWSSLGALAGIAVVLTGVVIGLSVALGKLKPESVSILNFKFNAQKLNLALLAASMVLIASSILILSGALFILSKIPYDSLVDSLLTVGGALVIFGLAGKYMKQEFSKNLLVLGAAIIVLSTGLVILSGALLVLALIPSDQLTKSLMAVAIALMMFGIAGKFISVEFSKNLLVLGAAVIVLSVGLVILSSALLLLSIIPADRLANSLMAVAIALMVFGIAGKFINAGMSLNIMLLGAAVIVLSIGLAILTVSLIALSNCDPTALADAMIGLLVVFGSFAGLGALLSPIAPALIVVAGAFDLFGLSVKLVGKGIEKAGNGFTSFVDSLEKLVHIKKDIGGIGESVKAAFKELKTALSKESKGFYDVGAEFATVIARGFADDPKYFDNTSNNFMDNMIASFKQNSSKWEDLGRTAARFYANGMLYSISDVRAAALQVVDTSLDTIIKAQDSNSPAKEFEKLGKFAADGYSRGIIDKLDAVESASKSMGANTESFAGESAKMIEGILSGNSSPVIRPVLDLSDIQKSGSLIGSYLPNSMNLDLSGAYNNALNSRNIYGGTNQASGGNQTNNKISNVFYIYGSEGQDVNELANIIMSKMENTYTKKVGVFR